MTDVLDSIEAKLRHAFTLSQLAVENESHLHAGHGGAAEHAAEFGDGPSHVHIAIEAQDFAGLSRLARHRAVMEVIDDEVAQLHALRLTISAPG
ncbi:BolA family protein [uncultured Algimonas sp.]|uniref:BolA family protein n=1 Tax=uncultured Algimonas sp. TaxID=1547920 RepID=UPI00261EEE2C|nr:BolA family protein [uncultured Algimonas sp.]